MRSEIVLDKWSAYGDTLNCTSDPKSWNIIAICVLIHLFVFFYVIDPTHWTEMKNANTMEMGNASQKSFTFSLGLYPTVFRAYS